MRRRVTEADLTSILQAIQSLNGSASKAEIANALTPKLPDRTLQFRLKNLLDSGALVREGSGKRWVKYTLAARSTSDVPHQPGPPIQIESTLPFSPASIQIRNYLSQPLAARKPTGYNRQFLDSYRPGAFSLSV
jgi:hypothetical protein